MSTTAQALQSKSLVEESPYYWNHEPRIFYPHEKLNELDPVAVDLFCGMGGLSLGLEMAGFQLALGLDIHRPSIETFRYSHLKAVAILGDIQRVLSLEKSNEDSLLCRALSQVIGARELDLLAAGIPCQGFSLANKKRSILDKRNYLFVYFVEATKTLKPKYVLIENVTGLVAYNNGSFVNDIKQALSEIGYHVEHRVLNAADYGVPQIRKRIIFMGCREGHSLFWPPPSFGTRSRPYRTVADAISDLPPLEASETSKEYVPNKELTEYQRLMRGNQNELLNHAAPNHQKSVIEKIHNTEPGEPMYERYKQRIRLHPHEPSPTQVSGGIRPQFQFGHPNQDRGLTVRERARIQSIPDWVKIYGGIVQGRVQTGNAVPPLLGKAIGDSIYMGLHQTLFVESLLKWGENNLRTFPWRKEGITPYEVLIAEILLRKTKAESIVPTYLQLIEKYPAPDILSKANSEELKKLLEPLGLSSIRTKALIDTGNILARRFFGTVPRDISDLRSLPHVGRYIANATLLFGYKIRRPIVDQNVQRLLGRVFNVEPAVEIHKANYLWDIVDKMMPDRDYMKFAWCLVDFPALVCTPMAPKHSVCPISQICKFYKTVRNIQPLS